MAAWLLLLGQALQLLNKYIGWLLSPEQISARATAKVNDDFQNFDKALKNNDAVFITGAAAELHDRVRTALRGR